MAVDEEEQREGTSIDEEMTDVRHPSAAVLMPRMPRAKKVQTRMKKEHRPYPNRVFESAAEQRIASSVFALDTPPSRSQSRIWKIPREERVYRR